MPLLYNLIVRQVSTPIPLYRSRLGPAATETPMRTRLRHACRRGIGSSSDWSKVWITQPTVTQYSPNAVSHHNSFLPAMHRLRGPLNKLFNKHRTRTLSEECQRAFDAAKSILCSVGKCCENFTTTKSATLPAFRSYASKAASPIMDTVVTCAPNTKSHKPDTSVLKIPAYTVLAQESKRTHVRHKSSHTNNSRRPEDGIHDPKVAATEKFKRGFDAPQASRMEPWRMGLSEHYVRADRSRSTKLSGYNCRQFH
ncbi:hypothetical protein CLF_103256 [Clonorchis sinensis]|uniref:Uncharacterized protein n=1 Tax=Clonorchis sinensis TaxID=79923 RepID=G7Y9E8_CLOSI|nr:hypothetical protein CLF_103256 [Clonorchis sinensis]